jgi:hypothetical protein
LNFFRGSENDDLHEAAKLIKDALMNIETSSAIELFKQFGRFEIESSKVPRPFIEIETTH